MSVTTAPIKKEFQRVFEFIVKHGVANAAWTNNSIKRFLRWAWYYERIFVVYDGFGASRRIAAVAVAWRQDHPDDSYKDMSIEGTEYGEYLHIYQVIVHPEYRSAGCFSMLLALALQRYPGTSKAFWTSHARGSSRKGRMIITDINTLAQELLKWDSRAKRKTYRSRR